MDFTNKKIGLLSFHSFKHPGGVKNHILGLAKEFNKRGIETKIIVPRRSRNENYGKDVILLGTSFPMPFNDSQGDLVVNFNPFAMRKTLQEENFDILHIHNFSLPSAFEILSTSPSTNILTFHANLDKSDILKRFPAFLKMFRKIAGWRIDGVIGVSPLVMDIFSEYKGPKEVIPNGVDTEMFNPKITPFKKYKDGKVNILFVGRMEKRKGLPYLLSAFKILQEKHDNIRLLIIGKGEQKKEAEEFVKKNKLKEVHFLGEVDDTEKAQFYATADIYCSPAPHGESFGIVLLEAMASGLPIVAFANQGYEQFFSGKKGSEFLAPPKNIKKLATLLEQFIDNEKLRKELGDWGYKEAQKYSWKIVADSILSFYEKAMKKE